VQIEAPTRSTLCLCAYIATNIRPPRYMEAVDSLTAVIKNKPNDFEAVRCFRSIMLGCLRVGVVGQEQVFTHCYYILKNYCNSMFCALQLVDRASCYFCLQEWAAGIKDLCYVLVFVPNHKKALLLR
jgi:hypothetical protein